MKVILIRYGELTLKGKNRKEFERILYNNIKKQLSDFDLKFSKDRNRIYIELDDGVFNDTIDILKIIPGISSFSLADICENDIDEICNLAVSTFDITTPIFKVETKRSNKLFHMTSPEVSRIVGGALLKNVQGLKVDVNNPQKIVTIEIQKDKSFVIHTTVRGMGGLPIGSSGRAMVLLSGGIDSPVAAVEAMKRGLKISCIHFSSPPYTNEKSLDKVKQLTSVLHKYDNDIKLYDVKFTEIQLAIHQNCFDKLEVTILRRMMLRAASRAARKVKAKVLITGEALGQVASQTITSMHVTDQTVDDLILRPLIMMDKSDIIEIARRIGTYEISILPYEDCCVVFLPKAPAISPKLSEVITEEAKINFDEMLDQTEINMYDYDLLNNKEKIINKYI